MQNKISLIRAVAFVWLAAASAANAMDGTFDRGPEVEKYLPIVKEGTRGTVLPLAKELYVSGIADPRLAAAVSERLLRDLPTLGIERQDSQYGAWMVKALASFGIEEYRATLTQIHKQSKVSAVRSACNDEIDKISWHKTKNEIMSSRKNFTGQKPRVAQFMNLLQSEDFTYKYLAADRMSWEKVLDRSLMDEIAAQIPRYMNKSSGRIETKTLGLYEKLLGYSEDARYRDVLQQVVNSKSTGTLLKKHAKEALDRLQ